ncbi:MAG: type II CRISPR RNA-guided endonuclease Cas9, partial [Eubacterium sp.]
INGEGISVELKQNIYNDLFKKGKRVTSKMLVKYLKDIGEVDADDNPEISGIDGDFTNRLANHKKFFEIFGTDNLTQEQINIAEDVIFYSTVYGDSRKFLSEKIREKYQNILDESQIKRILGMKFKDWGRFSRQLLELNGTDKQTGEVSSIISKMWNENYNFMELMAEDKFTYSEEIEQRVKKIEKTLSTMEYSDLDELYISAPVKRMVWQTILVLKELEKVMGYDRTKFLSKWLKDREKRIRERTAERRNF